MNLEKIAPWNWFKKEEEEKANMIPINHKERNVLTSNTPYDFQAEFDHFFNSIKENYGMNLSNNLLSSSHWYKPNLDIFSDNKKYNIRNEQKDSNKE